VSRIADLTLQEYITVPIKLQDIKVIWKSHDSAVIKQTEQGKAILLYRCARALEVGRRYDITVYRKKRYKGLDELTDIAVEHTLGSVNISPYLSALVPQVMQEYVGLTPSKLKRLKLLSQVTPRNIKKGLNPVISWTNC